MLRPSETYLLFTSKVITYLYWPRGIQLPAKDSEDTIENTGDK